MSAAAAREESGLHSPPREAPLVVTADDDPDILLLVRTRLQRAGYRVVTASDGLEAGAAAGADSYITKPFSPQDLESCVASVLGR